MSELRVKFSGYGGQGVILSAYIVGKATAIYDGKQASMTQAYGPEARGGACSSQLVIDKKAINYPLVDTTYILVALSQAGYDKFLPDLKNKGTLLYDNDLVSVVQDHSKYNALAIPATRLAEELGKRIVANIVMVGFVIAQTKLASRESMLRAIKESVPAKFIDLNLKAFEVGFNYKPSKRRKSGGKK